MSLVCVACGKQEQSYPAPPKHYATIDPSTAASVKGAVRFEGKPPEPQKLDMSQDPGCSLAGTPENFSEAYQVKAGGLQNVYVYVKDGLGAKVYAPPPHPVVLDQRGCRYIPHVLGMVAGQKLRILNSDPALHNVHPSPEHHDEWNISQQPGGEPIERVFDQQERMMPIRCNQHPWMKMYLNVSSNPFFAVTKEDGSFEIIGLPPGAYTIAALHERMGEKTEKVTVSAKDSKSLQFSFNQSEAR